MAFVSLGSPDSHTTRTAAATASEDATRGVGGGRGDGERDDHAANGSHGASIPGARMGTSTPMTTTPAEPVEDPEVVPSGDPSPIETPDPPATPQPGPDES